MKTFLGISFVCALALCFSAGNAAQKVQGHGQVQVKPAPVVKQHNVVRVKEHPARVTVKNRATVVRYSRAKTVVVKPRKVRVINTLPVGHATVLFGGRNYYYHGGLYYHLVGASYALLAPPFGLRIGVLPAGYFRVRFGGVPFFYYRGVYYQSVGAEYEVVEPQVGMVVPELPEDDVEEVTIDGKTYYEHNGILYDSIVTKKGVQYKVVGKLED